MKPSSKHCWVITDGSAGMENQAWGLGEALGYRVTIKRIALKTPWIHLAPFLRLGLRFCLSSSSDSMDPPWPELIIACGRRSILPTLYVKKMSLGKTKIVYLQDPKISPKHFDAIICPIHDKLQGKNVITMTGAPHRITENHLKEGQEKFATQFSTYSGPRYGVLIGGPNRVFKLTPQVAMKIANDLCHIQQRYNASLLISPSRRTPPEVIHIFKKAFEKNPRIYFWDNEGDNPYFAILEMTDIVLLTCDSVSMASEACYTSKPVYIIPLPGGSKKFSAFHDQLIKIGRTRWFEGQIENYPVHPFDETLSIAAKLKQLLNL